MRTFECQCGNRLFFHSTKCLGCDRQTGFCDCCRLTSAVNVAPNQSLTCSNSSCGAEVTFCGNLEPHGICNRLIPIAGSTEVGSMPGICDFCQLTSIIPDLSVEGNVEKWRRLENAKQRVLYMLDTLGLPFREVENSTTPPLRFEFKSDGEQPVPTGHDKGCIVINIKEADSVIRELSRVQLGEPQRTLVGHFRHELGHFFWDRVVKSNNSSLHEFRRLFGDERKSDYVQALGNYYQNGPVGDWQPSFVSAYSTMHPWEDFAETFATYIDMCSVLDTANHFATAKVGFDDLDGMVKSYSHVGVMANELNRDMGLLDLVPEVFTPPVVEKLRFVHLLCY